MEGDEGVKNQTRRRQFKRLVSSQFTPGQKALVKKHGTPSDFAIACHMTVPQFCSYDEAEAAAQKYRREFLAA
jgi:hypothetical protein